MSRVTNVLILAALTLAWQAPAIAQSKTDGYKADPGKSVAGKQAPAPPARVIPRFTPAPAIWRVADADTTIYLFGTIHLLDPALEWRSPRLEAVIAEAGELVVEAAETDTAKLEPALAKMLLADLEIERPPLLDRVPEAARPALREAIAAAGFAPAMFDRMPTWMAVFMLGYAGAGMGEATSEAGADASLEARFVAAGKPVRSIEDPMAVIESIRALPEAAVVALLVDTPAPVAAPEAGAEAGVDDIAWARGDIDGLAADLSEEALGAPLYDALIRRRNAAWTGWVQKRLEIPGTVLIAVGAGHLVGRDSLQTMLAARGVEARRLDR